MASNRTSACEKEEVVYRCVTTALNGGRFHTTWKWNNIDIRTFNSDDRIGKDTCGPPAANISLPFLHTTLVSTENNTCVSLLIVLPSLVSENTESDLNAMIECVATGALENEEGHNCAINHNVSSESLHVLFCSCVYM